MKRKRSTAKAECIPIERRRDWLLFKGHARMHVWNSGGPIHSPHERLLQLLIRPWSGDNESWTVYRNGKNTDKDGKVVFKYWDRETDLARFEALGDKPAPKEWCENPAVTERTFFVPAKWVRELERTLSSLSVPPIAGPVQSESRDLEFNLSLWRGLQESEFTWEIPPPAWRPLVRLFNTLLKNFRQHAKGKALGPIKNFHG
jgi:hypothetical protein